MDQFEYAESVADALNEQMKILNIKTHGAMLSVSSDQLSLASVAEIYATGKRHPKMLRDMLPNREFEFLQTSWDKIDKSQEKLVLADVEIIKSMYQEFEKKVKDLIALSQKGKIEDNRPSIFDDMYQDMHPGDED